MHRSNLDVGQLRVHAERDVGRQCPGGGGPGHEGGAVRVALNGEGYLRGGGETGKDT